MKRLRRYAGAVAALALVGLVAAGPAVSGTPSSAFPTLRLFAAQSDVIATRFKNEPASLDLGVYLTPVGGAFELDALRDAYGDPVQLQQIVRGGEDPETRSLPARWMDGWNGLSRFIKIVVTDDSGNVVAHTSATTCFDDWNVQRANDLGPANATYPSFCQTNPFTKGAVWGIDQGWALDPISFGQSMKVPDGHYTVTYSIAPRFVTGLGIAPQDASVSVGVTVATTSGCQKICAAGTPAHGPRHRASSPAGPAPTTDPSGSSLPDLIPLPAWSITIDHQGHKDFLDFAATVWDAGPGPMVIEGFRRPNSSVMDAFQYFYRDGKVVGKSPAGSLVYDPRPGHEHWHFKQFAAYRLLDSSMSNPVISHKEAFCLAPTDGIDLAVPGAVWRPDSIGFWSQCGTQSAIWTRETLPSGWGDTYYQSLPGQSFNITDLPNGTYYIQVQANPAGVIHESDTSNDITYRKVVLGGTPGARTVRVPPWHGIDG
jgi:hypothetical protein